MSLIKFTSAESFLDQKGEKTKIVLLFGASWHEACPSLEAVLTALAATTTSSTDHVLFGTVDAEAVMDLSDQYQVTSVPTILLWNGPSIVERLEGNAVMEPAQVTVAVQRLLSMPPAIADVTTTTTSTTTTTATTTSSVTPEPAVVAIDPKLTLQERLDRLTRSDAVMLFMKGTPTAPKCGFSRQAVELLDQHGIPFGSFDILQDNDVRQGLKTYSNWPTYPQIYVHGELQGGLDILQELAAEAQNEGRSLAEQWGLTTTPKTTKTTLSLQDRIVALTRQSPIMVFMKGLPSAPRCGFSRQLVELLDETGLPYDAFDILQDEEIRQGLKNYSNWPTYPQLYVQGELVGGLDICKELKESGDWLETLQQAPSTTTTPSSST